MSPSLIGFIATSAGEIWLVILFQLSHKIPESLNLDSSTNSFHRYYSLSFRCSRSVSYSSTPPWPVVSAPFALTLPISLLRPAE